MQKICGLKDCDRPLGPGASDVGFDSEGRTKNVRVCAKHTWDIMSSERGTFFITPDLRLRTRPAKRIII